MEERKREGERKRGSDVFEDGTGERRKEKEFLTVSCTHLRPDAAPTPG